MHRSALSVSILSLVATVPALAHHAFVDFDRGRAVEVEGDASNVPPYDCTWGN